MMVARRQRQPARARPPAGSSTIWNEPGSASRVVTASYSGDVAHSPASGSVTQMINKATTTTTLISDVNPSGAGQPVTFTATVGSATAVPTGTAKFKKGSTLLETVSLSGGVATFTTSSLPTGSDKITATYNATSDFASSSASVVQLVQ